ncbi:MAG TPA: AAA family ATPase [Planctomycetota bacterium]|nr:AAA family ATPase [Planctomycetota bacterium]
MRTIALINQKGGVGKSTTAVSLSAALARLGQRVLLVDLDPQAHSTLALGLDPKKLDTTVYTVLAGKVPAGDALRAVSERLFLLPSNVHLAGGEAELSMLPDPANVLKRAMEGIDDRRFDYVIVDCPPQLGFLNVNCLIWVHEVFIPVTCEFYALHGLSLLMDTVERIKSRLNPDLRISGVITCQVHPRRAITRDILSELEKHFPGRVLRTRIRVNVRLVEAPSHGKSIFEYAPDSHGAADYMSLAQEIHASAPAALTPESMALAGSEPAASPSAPEPEAAPVHEAVGSPEPAAQESLAAPEEPPIAGDAAPEGSVAEPVSAPVEAISDVVPDGEPEAPPLADLPLPTAAEAASGETPSAPAALDPSPAAASSPADPAPLAQDAPAVPEPVSASPADSSSTPAAPPFVELPPGAPLTTPVSTGAPAASPSASGITGVTSPYAQMLGMENLKPIVVPRRDGAPPPPPPEPAREKGHFGQRLFGKIIGRKR